MYLTFMNIDIDTRDLYYFVCGFSGDSFLKLPSLDLRFPKVN